MKYEEKDQEKLEDEPKKERSEKLPKELQDAFVIWVEKAVKQLRFSAQNMTNVCKRFNLPGKVEVTGSKSGIGLKVDIELSRDQLVRAFKKR